MQSCSSSSNVKSIVLGWVLNNGAGSGGYSLKIPEMHLKLRIAKPNKLCLAACRYEQERGRHTIIPFDAITFITIKC